MSINLQENVEILREMGYKEFQLQEIYRQAIGKTSVKNLTAEEEEKLALVLKRQVEFAEKCQQKLKSRK